MRLQQFIILKFIILIFLCSTNLFATRLPEVHPINGGVSIIPINAKHKPEAYFNNKRIAVSKSDAPNQWLLIAGIPLDNNAYIKQIKITKPYKALYPIYVGEKFYRTQHLTIKNKRKVDPYEQDRARINTEQKKMKALFDVYTSENPFAEGFNAPSNGPISSLFGLKRVYNKQPRPPHSGLDIASPDGSDVKVISSGKVVDVDNYFFTGNTVIVDHGMGVFSLYAHLKETSVNKNDRLKQGDKVGIVGMTGRVTGPHLHWSMIMNQTLVDPLLFVSAQTITTLPVKLKEVDKQDG